MLCSFRFAEPYTCLVDFSVVVLVYCTLIGTPPLGAYVFMSPPTIADDAKTQTAPSFTSFTVT